MKRSPSNSAHEFWSSAVGSRLFLEIAVPIHFDTVVRALIIKVLSVAKPIKYLITVVYSDGRTESRCHYRQEALCIVKHDWMAYYKSVTHTRFEEHKNYDLSSSFSSPHLSPREWVLDKLRKFSPRKQLYKCEKLDTDEEFDDAAAAATTADPTNWADSRDMADSTNPN